MDDQRVRHNAVLDTKRRFTEAASGFNNCERSERHQTARQLQRTLGSCTRTRPPLGQAEKITS